MLIDEAFEIQVQLNGIDIGNAHAVGHDGIGTTTPPYVVKAPELAIADDIMGNEEVLAKAHFVDHLQLAF